MPDAHPSLVSPETAYAAVAGRDARWDGRLIAGGAMDDGGLPALASRLAVSPRHPTRLVVAEVGATPGQLARTRPASSSRRPAAARPRAAAWTHAVYDPPPSALSTPHPQTSPTPTEPT